MLRKSDRAPDRSDGVRTRENSSLAEDHAAGEPSFEMRGDNGAKLSVFAIRREFPDTQDPWDGNWFFAVILLTAGGFSGKLEASLRSDEFARFRTELAPLHENLAGRAQFASIDTWLSIDIAGDGNGRFTAACVAVDRPGTGNRLRFVLDLDATQIPQMLRQVDAILESFPVLVES